MISGIFLISQKGQVVLSRFYRDNSDIVRSSNAFRLQVIAAKETGTKPPIVLIDGNTFQYIRHQNLYLVAVTRANANPSLTFEYLYQLNRIFKAYLGEKYTENSIRNHFTLIYELLEESMDYGYPQNCTVDVLKMFVNLGTTLSRTTTVIAADSSHSKTLTSQITGAIDWRRDGILHKRNEVFLDVIETVNLLLSSTGTVLRNDVSGKVMMKTMLSGMPECKIGLNDKLIMDAESKKNVKSVALDDCSFHRCVRLGKFDSDRAITFIPPDGEFELMRYRVTENVNLPFKILSNITVEGATRVSVSIKITADFHQRLFATDVVIKIPAPGNTARCKIDTNGAGTIKYEPESKAVVWRIRKFVGRSEHFVTGYIELMKSTREKAWVKQPLAMEFNIPMFTSSGTHIRFLKVFEKSSYQTTKWVRYITRAGDYQIRV